MKQEVFTYLRSYSTTPKRIDRLIVSAFMHSINILNIDNELLGSYFISEHDEDHKKLTEFLTLHKFSTFEELIEVFEFVISPEEKIVTGAIYTPRHIREYIITQAISEVEELEQLKLCDPACGCSGFLFTAAKKLKALTGQSYQYIFDHNLFGLDIQNFSITRSKLLLTLLAISEGEDLKTFNYNLYQGNALNYEWSKSVKNFKGFDIIVGNPPYVCSRNIDDETKSYLENWSVCASGHPDLYIPFFQIGVENLKARGVLGYITMNTFFKSINGRALRQYFEDRALDLRILDFGGNQVFQSKSTYTCICFIKNVKSKSIKYAKVNKTTIQEQVDFKSIYYAGLNHRNGWNLQNAKLLNQIEKKGTPFGDLYRTRNGIATLKNHIFIFKPVKEDDHYYYIQNGATYPIEKGICKEIINPNKLTQLDDIDKLRQKVIFPYKYSEQGDAVLIAEHKIKEEYPGAYTYFKDKRAVLATRDKGKGKYENWYAYGRNQSLERYSCKLFFPHITPHIPNFKVNTDENLLFYNGLAVISEDEFELQFLKKLMSSNLFWFYIKNSSKPYGSGYFSLSRNYIKGFGVCNFTKKEKETLIRGDSETVNELIEDKYEISLDKL